MWIVVDSNEARTGLAGLLAESWEFVRIRRLPAGDVAIGGQVLVERKTVDDLIASLADGRLFDQARRLATLVSKPILIQEGDPAAIEARIDSGSYRGALLSLSVGFRIPVLLTTDLQHTAVLLRHMAAQEAKRESRRRRRERLAASDRGPSSPRGNLPPEAVKVLCAMPGVGRTRAEALAAHVRSLRDLAQLSVRDLLAVPGIGPDTAARIIDTLREHQPDKPA